MKELITGFYFSQNPANFLTFSHKFEELRQNARPELSSAIENLDNYNVIFLGYPNWNADLPMPLHTFLDTYDLSRKNVVYSLVDFGRHGAWSGWGCPTLSHSPTASPVPSRKSVWTIWFSQKEEVCPINAKRRTQPCFHGASAIFVLILF